MTYLFFSKSTWLIRYFNNFISAIFFIFYFNFVHDNNWFNLEFRFKINLYDYFVGIVNITSAYTTICYFVILWIWESLEVIFVYDVFRCFINTIKFNFFYNVHKWWLSAPFIIMRADKCHIHSVLSVWGWSINVLLVVANFEFKKVFMLVHEKLIFLESLVLLFELLLIFFFNFCGKIVVDFEVLVQNVLSAHWATCTLFVAYIQALYAESMVAWSGSSGLYHYIQAYWTLMIFINKRSGGFCFFNFWHFEFGIFFVHICGKIFILF